MNEPLFCSLCGKPLRPNPCDCARRLLGSNMERDRAVAQLGRTLERQEPNTEKPNFLAFVPSEDELPDADPELEAERITQARAVRLTRSGMARAITDEDFRCLTRAWKVVETSGSRRRILPVYGKPAKVGEGGVVFSGGHAFEHQTEAMANVTGWENARSTRTSAFGVLVLLGLMGVGKTVSLGWPLARRGGLYTTCEMLRASFEAEHYRERELYLSALKARVLIVDEMAREKASADAMMFDLVNNRRGAGLEGRFWTGFASNLSDEEFRPRYDPSTLARIEQLGMILKCEGPNLRGRLADELRRQKEAKRGGG